MFNFYSLACHYRDTDVHKLEWVYGLRLNVAQLNQDEGGDNTEVEHISPQNGRKHPSSNTSNHERVRFYTCPV